MDARAGASSSPGHEFETLSDEDTLAFLLVSLCEDLRRGACRAKHFLDLYLMLRALDSQMDWERFCERQRERGVLKVAINVLRGLLRALGLRRGVSGRRARARPGGCVWWSCATPKRRWC